jgi:NTE family protein
MLFHTGALWRLCETGWLEKIDRISSVSGGSIVAAVLGLNWGKLHLGHPNTRDAFAAHVVEPVRRLARHTIDWQATIQGVIPFANPSAAIARAYDRHLFDGASPTLQKLPNHPRFIINAANLQSGAVWRFSKPYMRDWRVGEILRPDINLAYAAAASSAFPPFLSPLYLKLNPASFTPASGADLQYPPYTTMAVLTDGGVYDNLGLETIWKRYNTVLISDGGQKLKPQPKSSGNWFGQLLRIRDIADDQTRSLRKRVTIDSFERRLELLKTGVDLAAESVRGSWHAGAYWGIGTDIAGYQLSDALPCPFESTLALAQIGTRLACMDEVTQQRLINWGYGACDAALRRYVDPSVSTPPGFPYEGGVG